MKPKVQTEPMHEPAPAKVNLALHVTGRREDGYHLLDSLVVFADYGDRLEAEPALNHVSLVIDGPFAAGLDAKDNLVLRAARLMAPSTAAVSLRLTKNLPVAAGLGGGSADAAAMLRLGHRLWQKPLPGLEGQLSLGADVPACVQGVAQHMRGIGEILTPCPVFRGLHLVLVNPGIGLDTRAVYAQLSSRDNTPLGALPATLAGVPDWLAQQRNDMQDAAIRLCPPVADCIAALRGQAALLARMSGSGATCFGLFATAQAAEDAAENIAKAAPGWWVRACAAP